MTIEEFQTLASECEMFSENENCFTRVTTLDIADAISYVEARIGCYLKCPCAIVFYVYAKYKYSQNEFQTLDQKMYDYLTTQCGCHNYTYGY